MNTQVNTKIVENTKLSFVLRACFGLSQVKLNNEIVENYRRILRHYMDSIQHNPDYRETYTELRNIIQVYQALAEAIEKQKLISQELTRLTALGLPPKTIDRRLKAEWSEQCIEQPITKLNALVEKAMLASERLNSFELAGRNNSLAGLVRQLQSTKTKKKEAA